MTSGNTFYILTVCRRPCLYTVLVTTLKGVSKCGQTADNCDIITRVIGHVISLCAMHGLIVLPLTQSFQLPQPQVIRCVAVQDFSLSESS